MSTTLKMSVDQMGFLLDKFSQDCGPLQYIRELTQNSIEAIRKAGREHGVINWSYDEAEFEKSGIKKLCITDNGCGMSGDGMEFYLNNLSASGSNQAFDANFGVGAKISSYAKNQCGVTYLSFQNGDGNIVQVWKDPGSGDYGLKSFDGAHVASLLPGAVARYPEIGQFGAGTHVVLHGMSDNEDTFSASKESPVRGQGQWVRRYLNTRYFRLPTNIEINCRVAGGGDEGSRYVTGQGPMLDGISLERGTVQLSGAMAHWWILPSSKKGTTLPRPLRLASSGKDINVIDTLGPGYDINCHVAAVFQNELHDTFVRNAARVLMQQFGVIFGFDQVVIYVEPVAGGVAPNMARTHLLINSEPLPWSDWADEFRAKLPRAIKEFMDQIQPSKHDSKTEDDRIKSVMDLFKVTKFKVDASGDKWIPKPDTGGRPAVNGGTRSGSGTTGKRGGVASESAYTDMINRDGARGTEVAVAQGLPEVVLVSASEEEALARVFGASLATQAADRPLDMYNNHAGWFASPNTINLNLDFGGLRVFVERFTKEYPETEAAKAVVAQSVLSWWSQTLKEAVHGIRTLAHSRVWSKEEAMRALEGDSGAAILTAAVMPRYLVHQAIKREITGKLGKSKASKDEEE